MWMPIGRSVRLLDDLNPPINLNKSQYANAWVIAVYRMKEALVEHGFCADRNFFRALEKIAFSVSFIGLDPDRIVWLINTYRFLSMTY